MHLDDMLIAPSEPWLISYELSQPWDVHEQLDRVHLLAWQLPPILAAALPEEHLLHILCDAFSLFWERAFPQTSGSTDPLGQPWQLTNLGT